MDAPTCGKCGSKHWSTQPCPGGKPAPPTVYVGMLTIEKLCMKHGWDGIDLIGFLDKRLAQAAHKPKPADTQAAFDRKAYEREYKKKRRAEARTQRPPTST